MQSPTHVLLQIIPATIALEQSSRVRANMLQLRFAIVWAALGATAALLTVASMISVYWQG